MAASAKGGTINTAEMLRRIRARQGNWVGLKGSLDVRFAAESGASARCRGSLNYHRLDEKILLRCFNDAGAMIFAFRTEDQFFELYMTEQKRLYSGSIFELEDAKHMDSRLKPLALYRALKVMSYPLERSEIETSEGSHVTLIVYGPGRPPSEISRRFESSLQGDVYLETFYDAAGMITTTIYRSEFGPGASPAPAGQPTAFPKKVRIQSTNPESNTTDEMELTFREVSFASDFSPADWQLTTAQGTESIALGSARTAGFRDRLGA